MSITHIAGVNVTVATGGTELLRQRCGWCGETLLEYNLARVAAPVGQEGPPATWPAGVLVTVDGNMSTVPDDSEGLPADACARNPLTFVTLV